MARSELATDFCRGKTLRHLAAEACASIPVVRNKLIAELGRYDYTRQARANGGHAIAAKLAEPEYRKQYAAKMSRSVSESIRERMTNTQFRQRWLNKAKAASNKGVSKIRTLMEKNEFRARWKEKCRKGGMTCAKRENGMFAASKNKRRAWSLAGLRKTGKKLLGPNGERMYNWLELRVAQALTTAQIPYEYEKIVKAPNKNGFFSIDFFINGKNKIFAEATCWDDVNEKSSTLTQKFEFLATEYPNAKLVLIAKRNDRLAYAGLLNRSIYILTPAQLICLVKEAKHTPS